jgi:hypothetical protein
MSRTPNADALMVFIIFECLIFKFLKKRNAKIAVVRAKMALESATYLYQATLPEMSYLHAPHITVAQEQIKEINKANPQNLLLWNFFIG